MLKGVKDIQIRLHLRSQAGCGLIPTCIVLVFAGILVMSASFHNKAHATTAGDLQTASCDPEYYDTLKARAWLLGARKMRQAQNYIFKPDSVLDYSCFPILNNIAALETEQIFSEAHAGHCYPDSLDCSLELIVMTPVNAYLSANFNHTFLGGNSGVNRTPYDPDDTNMCTTMTDIWQLAKCTNFAPESSLDSFYSFIEYASLEPRDKPDPCTNNVASQWTGALDAAYNTPSWVADIRNASNDIHTMHETYTKPVAPTSIPSPAPSCGDFVPTGVSIQDDESAYWTTAVPDGICTNPGCTQTDSGSCVEIF